MKTTISVLCVLGITLAFVGSAAARAEVTVQRTNDYCNGTVDVECTCKTNQPACGKEGEVCTVYTNVIAPSCVVG